MTGRLDPMQKARDFTMTPRPRVRPTSPARKLDAIARQAREASVAAVLSGGGAASSVPIFDSLPDATPEDVGQIIYVAGAAGQPAQGYIGVQTQDDRVIWEPVFTQAFYGAATEFIDEFYNSNNWIQTLGGGSVTNALGASFAGHPGNVKLGTAGVAGDDTAISLGVMRLGDVDRAAFIFRTMSTITSTEIRVGFLSSVTADPVANGVFLQIDSGQTAWQLCKAIAGTETLTQIFAAAADNWYLFQVEYAGTPGSFVLTLTDLSGALGSQGLVVTGLNEAVLTFPVFHIESGAASVRDLLVDYFWIRHRATVRS